MGRSQAESAPEQLFAGIDLASGNHGGTTTMRIVHMITRLILGGARRTRYSRWRTCSTNTTMK